jgi:hypothetical protein
MPVSIRVQKLFEQINLGHSDIYNNFVPFYEGLNLTLCSGSFIPDFIVNLDETAVHARQTRASQQVLCAQDVQQVATQGEELIDDHATLCCGVSASG